MAWILGPSQHRGHIGIHMDSLGVFWSYVVWLVVGPTPLNPLKNMKVNDSMGMIILNIWENKKCSKPPISLELPQSWHVDLLFPNVSGDICSHNRASVVVFALMVRGWGRLGRADNVQNCTCTCYVVLKQLKSLIIAYINGCQSWKKMKKSGNPSISQPKKVVRSVVHDRVF